MPTFPRDYDQELSARIGEALYLSEQPLKNFKANLASTHVDASYAKELSKLLTASETRRRQLIDRNTYLTDSRFFWILIAVAGWTMFIIFLIAFFVT